MRRAQRAAAAGARVVTSAPGRARQLAAGARLAKGDTILFLHADTRLASRLGCERARRARRSARRGRRVPAAFRAALARAAPDRVGRAPARCALAACPMATRRCSCAGACWRRWAACRRRRSWRISIWCAASSSAAGSRACRPAVTTSARRYRAAGAAAHDAAQLARRRRLVAGTAARADRRVVSPVNATADARARPRRPAPPGAATCCATAATTRYGPRPRSPTSRDSSPCPMLVGWSVKAVIEGLPGAGGGAARALARDGHARPRGGALLLAHARLQRRARDRVRAAQRRLRPPREASAVVLLPLAHRRHHEPLRQRHERRADAARRGAAQRRADADPLSGRGRRDVRDEREARAARADPVSRLHLDRTLVRALDPSLESRHPGRPRRALEPAPGDDLGHRRGEGLRDGERHVRALREGEPGALPAAAGASRRPMPRCRRS